jgi:hypothetical protein
VKNIQAGFAEQTEGTALDMLLDKLAYMRSSGALHAFATRGTWNNAASGEMSGSSPLPEAVTRSDRDVRRPWRSGR